MPFTVEGRAIARARADGAIPPRSAGYFETMRIPLVRGRTFSERDTDKTQSVAVVNEALASQWLRGLDPVGARLLVDDNDGAPRPVEVVGVVGNVKQIALDAETTWDLYLTYPQIHPDTVAGTAANMFWAVRTSGDPIRLVTVQSRGSRIDPEAGRTDNRSLSIRAVAPAASACPPVAVRRSGCDWLSRIYAVMSHGMSQRAARLGSCRPGRTS